MARYIDADLLLQRLTGCNSSVEQGVKYFNSVYNIIKEQPTADVVEVVRCKDCKYWRTEHGGFCQASNALSEVNNENNDFCSYGERKEECR